MAKFRTIWLAGVVLGVMWLLPQVASACPMCAETLASEKDLPRAFMYSIIFMLSVPALVLAGFAIVVYRTIKRREVAQQAAFEQLEAQDQFEQRLAKGQAGSFAGSTSGM